jgi:anti-sigma factor RsiW
MDCKEALSFIHEHFDGTLQPAQSATLLSHLESCDECRNRFHSIEKTEAMVHALARTEAPAQLTAKIMLSLPPVHCAPSSVQWVRRHPAVSVVAAMVIILLGSMIVFWHPDAQLTVRGDDLSSVIIENNRVIVPSGAVMHGNLEVHHGDVLVDGEVEGNLIIIDGKIDEASQAHITGEIKQVDRTFDWLWYKISQWFAAFKPQPKTSQPSANKGT